MRIYSELSGSRQKDQGIGSPIDVSQFEAYCRLFRVTYLDDIEEAFRYVSVLDSVYLEHQRKQIDAATAANRKQ